MSSKSIRGGSRGPDFYGHNVSGKTVQYHTNQYNPVSDSAKPGISASGGITTSFMGNDGFGYKIHQFTSSPETFSVSSIGYFGGDCDVIIIGGGGGGGASYGGGGGAGGVVAGTVTVSTSPGSYAISVGGGGAKSGGGGAVPGSDGTPTTAFGVTALGGGGGGSGPSPASPGNSGGSGGGTDGVSPSTGGAADQPGQSIPGTMTNYGNAGGGPGSDAPLYACGGGGGAGGAGGSPSLRYGGPGIAIPTFMPQTPDTIAQTFSPTGNLASGGAGGQYAGTAPQISSFSLPSGGGVAGRSNPPFELEVNGVANTGGGGGGSSPIGYTGGGNGGSGVVLVRYKIPVSLVGS